MILAIKREVLLSAMADPEFASKLDRAKSMEEFMGILEKWCHKKNISIQHI